MRIQTRRQQIQELTAENKRLVKTQELLVDNILTVQEKDTTYTGNRYKDYTTAVAEVSNKYLGVSDYGVLQVGNIVDLRAAYIVGQGIKISADTPGDEDATREVDFAQRFIEINQLDHELPQDLAREGEIEGKVLVKLFPISAEDAEGGVDIAVRWISWTTNKYSVVVSRDDYLQLEKVTWNPPAGSPVTLLPEDCVYKRFAGRMDVPNETMPRVAKCLTQIENLDQALRDWRQINKLYAAPTPHVQCDTAQQAKELGVAMESINWKIGKFFAHTGVFSYAQPSSEGQAAIESEIITLMKLISGTTGVPIHFLGAPELTTKYGAASEGLLEMIAMSTAKEREIWRGAYQEMLTKAMLKWNAETKMTALNPKLVRVELPVVTEAQWARLTSVWLPMRTGKEISQKTFLRQVPGLDVDKEIEELEGEDSAEMEKFTDQPDPNADIETEQDANEQGAGGNMAGLTGQVLKYKSNPGNFAKRGEGR
ncbi:MAG: hypothetical protein M0R06_03230 [Sphaerochaeta sp.]|jgi:hypothetical protein|nr:hypothetical protein [Sphaerochaeta sp.]